MFAREKCGHLSETFDVFAIHRRFLMSLSVLCVCFAFAVDRRFDVCVLISAYFCACVNAGVMTQLGGCQVLKDTKDLGGYLGTYPITRKGG